ncbi:MAG: sodium:solute symporter [Pseudomonadota bacterium]
MHAADWFIVAAYLAYVLYAGARLRRHSSSAESFFLGGRELAWWAVGLSVMATQMSAITLVGATGQAYTDGMRFIQFYFGLPLAMIVLCITAVPLFYRARVYTAYEFLERRFDAQTRSLTSLFFLLSRGLGVGVIIAAPSVILSIVLGWSEVATIVMIGAATTVYTMLGGVRAVTWTDVRQMIVIVVGLIACVFVIIKALPESITVGDGLRLAGAVGKLETIDFRFDLTERYTIWSGMFAAFFLFLSYFGCDQSQVQRYLTARSVDEGRTSLLMSAFLKIPLQFLILLIGILIFVFYQFHQPPPTFHAVAAEQAAAVDAPGFSSRSEELRLLHEQRRQAAIAYTQSRGDEARARYQAANAAFTEQSGEFEVYLRDTVQDPQLSDVNYVFPRFVLDNMPVGVIGLIIAAIMAAAMSSVAAELNSLATATTMDFYRRWWRPDGSERETVAVARIATALWGGFACVVATFATNLGSLIEVVNRFGSYFYGSLLGVFVLAFAFPRVQGRGAFYGLLLGMCAVWLASSYSSVAFLWFNVVGCVVTVAAGCAISFAETLLKRRLT